MNVEYANFPVALRVLVHNYVNDVILADVDTRMLESYVCVRMCKNKNQFVRITNMYYVDENESDIQNEKEDDKDDSNFGVVIECGNIGSGIDDKITNSMVKSGWKKYLEDDNDNDSCHKTDTLLYKELPIMNSDIDESDSNRTTIYIDTILRYIRNIVTDCFGVCDNEDIIIEYRAGGKVIGIKARLHDGSKEYLLNILYPQHANKGCILMRKNCIPLIIVAIIVLIMGMLARLYS